MYICKMNHSNLTGESHDVGSTNTSTQVQAPAETFNTSNMVLNEPNDPVVKSRLERSLMLQDPLLRPTLVVQQTIATTDVAFNRMSSSGADLIALWMNSSAVARVIGLYEGITADFEVTIQCNSLGTAYGMYVVQIVPDGDGPPAALSSFSEVCPQTQLQAWTCFHTAGATVNVSQSNNATVTLPYIGSRSWYVATGGPYKMLIHCLVKMTNAMNTNALSSVISVYVNAKPGYVVSAPIRQMLSGSMKAASNIATSVADNVPILSAAATVASSVLNVGSTIASALGLTKEAKQVEPIGVMQVSSNGLASTNGVEDNDTTALTVENSCAGIASSNSVDDLLSFKYLLGIESMVAVFSITDTTTLGFNIITIPVSPFFCLGSPAPQNAYYPCVAGYIGMPFEYWRATMKYRIIIPASYMHRYSLQFWWDDTNSGAAADVTSSTYNQIVDVNGTLCHELSISMINPNRYLRSRLTNPADLDYAAASTLTYVNGYLKIKLMSKVQAPIATTLTGMIFASCTDANFQVPKVYANTMASGNTAQVSNTISEVFYVQSAEGVGSATCTEVSKPLVDQVQDIDDLMYFGESIQSIRPLMQKFSPAGTYSTNQTTDVANMSLYHLPMTAAFLTGGTYVPQYGGFSPSAKNFPFNWAAYYSLLYMGVKGSTNVKVVPFTNFANYATQYPLVATRASIPPTVIATSFGFLNNNGAGQTINMNQHALNSNSFQHYTQLKFPYYFPLAYMEPRFMLNQTITGQTPIELDVIMQYLKGAVNGVTNQWNATMLLYQAYNSDFNVTMFRGGMSIRRYTS